MVSIQKLKKVTYLVSGTSTSILYFHRKTGPTLLVVSSQMNMLLHVSIWKKITRMKLQAVLLLVVSAQFATDSMKEFLLGRVEILHIRRTSQISNLHRLKHLKTPRKFLVFFHFINKVDLR